MRAVLAFLAALPALALAEITITGPDSSSYWVANTSNKITWTYSSGDPTPISIIIVNSNLDLLNGAFSIDEYIDVALETFTVTNVTLKTGDGYQVEFINPANSSDVYATGGSFTVKPGGTTPAAASSSSSNSSSNSSVSHTSTATSSGASSTSTGNSAVRAESVLYALAACGFASLSSLML